LSADRQHLRFNLHIKMKLLPRIYRTFQAAGVYWPMLIHQRAQTIGANATTMSHKILLQNGLKGFPDLSSSQIHHETSRLDTQKST
jgi:hypothetical protein